MFYSSLCCPGRICSIAVCAAPGRICSTEVCDAPGRIRSFYSRLYCLDMSQQPVLSLVVLQLDMSFDKSLFCTLTCAYVQHMGYMYKSLCCTCKFLCLKELCAASVRVCLVSAKAFVLHLDVSFDKSLCSTFMCAFVQHLNLSVYIYKSLCYTYTCTFLCLQELCSALAMFVYQSLCCTCTCMSTRAFVLHLDVSVKKSLCWTCRCCPGFRLKKKNLNFIKSVLMQLHVRGRVSVLQLYVSFYNSFVLNLDVPFYLSPWKACFGLVRNSHVCTVHMFETPKQTETNNRNRMSFDSFRLKPNFLLSNSRKPFSGSSKVPGECNKVLENQIRLCRSLSLYRTGLIFVHA
jgi:hypothetical protein